jgi:ABC-type branched-subunit amino acid transport system ATPase component
VPEVLAPPDATILDVQGITAGYGGPPIISDVSLRATRGKLTALVGPNGAGKSTFIKVVAGLIKPDSGRVMLEDKDVTGVPAQLLVRRGISYVPQVSNVFPTLTVLENLEMGAYTRIGRTSWSLVATPSGARENSCLTTPRSSTSTSERRSDL